MTDRPARPIEQYIAKPYGVRMSLIPPLAGKADSRTVPDEQEFEVYGGADTTERARQWALNGRYLLASGIPACAHGLYLLDGCPSASCRSSFPQLDHAGIWVPASVCDGRPFLLSHPYSEEISARTHAYAEAHGLAVGSYPEFGDGWYGHGSMPIRLSLPPSWPLWPIEERAIVLLSTQPVRWPDDQP